MQIIFSIGIQIFELSLFYMFMNAFLNIDDKNKKYIYILGTMAVIIFTFSKTYDAFNSLIVSANLFNVFVYLFILFVFSLPYSGKINTKIFITIVFVLFSYVMEMLASYIVCILSHETIVQMTYGTMILAISASSIMKLVVINILASTKKRKTDVADSPINIVMLMIPIVSVAILFSISKIFIQISNLKISYVIVILLGIIYINLVMFYLFNYMNKLSVERMNVTLFNQEVKSNQELYQKILEGQSELRNIKHDLKNRLSGIYSLLQNDNYEKSLSEINNIIDNVDDVSEIQYSNNILVNSILNYKIDSDKTKGIKITTDINLPNEINIESGDLGVLIGNLLDNAIEACQHIKDSAFININCIMRINVFIFTIENSCNSEEFLQKSISFDRINHGRGIKNVKKLVEKYKGNLQINEEIEDIFKVEVTVLV